MHAHISDTRHRYDTIMSRQQQQFSLLSIGHAASPPPSPVPRTPVGHSAAGAAVPPLVVTPAAVGVSMLDRQRTTPATGAAGRSPSPFTPANHGDRSSVSAATALRTPGSPMASGGPPRASSLFTPASSTSASARTPGAAAAGLHSDGRASQQSTPAGAPPQWDHRSVSVPRSAGSSGSGGSPLPVVFWVPDEWSDECFSCKRRFTFFRRRVRGSASC